MCRAAPVTCPGAGRRKRGRAGRRIAAEKERGEAAREEPWARRDGRSRRSCSRNRREGTGTRRTRVTPYPGRSRRAKRAPRAPRTRSGRWRAAARASTRRSTGLQSARAPRAAARKGEKRDPGVLSSPAVMRKLRRAGVRLLGAAIGGLLAVGAAAERPAADLIVENARVHTVDRARPEGQAVAVVGERIVAAGSSADVRA